MKKFLSRWNSRRKKAFPEPQQGEVTLRVAFPPSEEILEVCIVPTGTILQVRAIVEDLYGIPLAGALSLTVGGGSPLADEQTLASIGIGVSETMLLHHLPSALRGSPGSGSADSATPGGFAGKKEEDEEDEDEDDGGGQTGDDALLQEALRESQTTAQQVEYRRRGVPDGIIKIRFVHGDDSVALTVSETATFEEIASSLRAVWPAVPSSFLLSYSGERLDASQRPEDWHLSDGETLLVVTGMTVGDSNPEDAYGDCDTID